MTNTVIKMLYVSSLLALTFLNILSIPRTPGIVLESDESMYKTAERGTLQTHTTIVVFSKDRPLQLYAFLESLYHYVRGTYTVITLYTTSHKDYERGYTQLQAEFPYVEWLKQEGPHDFKKLMLEALYERPGDYCMFAVDDIIVKDFVDLDECVMALEQTGAYGFYLRLGLNITHSYSLRLKSGLPLLKRVAPNLYVWKFKSGTAEWNYRGSCDMTLYRKKDIKHALVTLNYSVPNAFEAAWQPFISQEGIGLCYEQSKIVNIPLNLVQSYAKHNRNMGSFTPRELLNKFLAGLKIAIKDFYQINNSAPHMDAVVRFIARNH